MSPAFRGCVAFDRQTLYVPGMHLASGAGFEFQVVQACVSGTYWQKARINSLACSGLGGGLIFFACGRIRLHLCVLLLGTEAGHR